MGLTTASAIERAYKKDTKLLWRIITSFARARQLVLILWCKLCQTVTWSEHFRPYFKRWRVRLPLQSFTRVVKAHTTCLWQNQMGVAMIEKAGTYISRGKDALDQVVIKTMVDGNKASNTCFFEIVMKILVRLTFGICLSLQNLCSFIEG